MIKLIIFDCWGTLFTTGQRPHPFELLANKLGHTAADRSFVKRFESHLMLDAHEDFETPLRALLDDLGIPPRPELLEELEGYLQLSIAKQTAYPDTMEVLGRLKSQYHLVMLTNSFRQGYHALSERYHLDKLFDTVITSYDRHLMKPDPRLFRSVIAASPYEPAQMLMVGDNPHDDIEPALQLGLQAVLIDRLGKYPAHPGRITELAGLEALLA